MTPYKRIFKEGVWATPFKSINTAKEFIEIMKSPILLGVNDGAEKIIGRYVGDDGLYDQFLTLREKKEDYEDYDVREIVKAVVVKWVEDYYRDPSSFKRATPEAVEIVGNFLD